MCLRDDREKLLTKFPQYHVLPLHEIRMLSPIKWEILLPSVPKHFFKQVITVPREAESIVTSQWEKAGKCSQIAEGHTSKQWPAQREHPAVQTWYLKCKPQSSTFHLSSHLHIRNLVGWWDGSVFAFTQSAKGFFPIKMNVTTNIFTDFISSLQVIQKGVCEPGTFSRWGKIKTLGFLQNPALTPEYPKISLLRLIRCHLPTHQLSCNQCMSLPTWHSLCLAQLYPDTPTLSCLWLWKSIYPWIDSVCTDAACCGSSALNFGWLTQRWTCEKDHSVDITINKQYRPSFALSVTAPHINQLEPIFSATQRAWKHS